MPSGLPFWAHYTPKLWKIARYFGTNSRSVPSLFHHDVQVYDSADKAEHLERYFERTHHLTLDVGTANHACVVNGTVSNGLRPPPPPPALQWGSAHKPIWTPTCNLVSQNLTCPGTNSIGATAIQNLSRKALILAGPFNRILIFGFFPTVWKSAKVIPIPHPENHHSNPVLIDPPVLK